jgi:hypothetical protein
MGDPMFDNLQVVEGLNIRYHDKLKFVGHGLTEVCRTWLNLMPLGLKDLSALPAAGNRPARLKSGAAGWRG